MPRDLTGATIVQLGTIEDGDLLEGGGLVVDYRPPGTERVRRIVFEFNEAGMWIRAATDHEPTS